MRAAVIDVGSNSVRLLVADGQDGGLVPVYRERQMTRLMHGVRQGVMDASVWNITSQAVLGMAETARLLGAEVVWAFGTSALRDANDGEYWAGKMREEGIKMDILTGEQEALLAYTAARMAFCGQESIAVLDIGGGSTEWLVGHGDDVVDARSFQLGAVRLMDHFPDDDAEGMKKTLAHADAVFADCQTPSADFYVGMGGTLTQLAVLEKARNSGREVPLDAVQGNAVDRQIVQHWMDTLCGLDITERSAILGMQKGREEILPYGLAIVLAAMERFGFSTLHVSDTDNLQAYFMLQMVRDGYESN